MDGADDRIRTDDLRITNALLYQLSYVGLESLPGGEATADSSPHF